MRSLGVLARSNDSTNTPAAACVAARIAEVKAETVAKAARAAEAREKAEAEAKQKADDEARKAAAAKLKADEEQTKRYVEGQVKRKQEEDERQRLAVLDADKGKPEKGGQTHGSDPKAAPCAGVETLMARKRSA